MMITAAVAAPETHRMTPSPALPIVVTEAAIGAAYADKLAASTKTNRLP
jgi:hypothetical protein